MDIDLNDILASDIASKLSYDSPWRIDDKWNICTYMTYDGETTLVQCPDCNGKEAPAEWNGEGEIKQERMDIPWAGYDCCDHCGKSPEDFEKQSSKSEIRKAASLFELYGFADEQAPSPDDLVAAHQVISNPASIPVEVYHSEDQENASIGGSPVVIMEAANGETAVRVMQEISRAAGGGWNYWSARQVSTTSTKQAQIQVRLAESTPRHHASKTNAEVPGRAVPIQGSTPENAIQRRSLASTERSKIAMPPRPSTDWETPDGEKFFAYWHDGIYLVYQADVMPGHDYDEPADAQDLNLGAAHDMADIARLIEKVHGQVPRRTGSKIAVPINDEEGIYWFWARNSDWESEIHHIVDLMQDMDLDDSDRTSPHVIDFKSHCLNLPVYQGKIKDQDTLDEFLSRLEDGLGSASDFASNSKDDYENNMQEDRRPQLERMEADRKFLNRYKDLVRKIYKDLRESGINLDGHILDQDLGYY